MHCHPERRISIAEREADSESKDPTLPTQNTRLQSVLTAPPKGRRGNSRSRRCQDQVARGPSTASPASSRTATTLRMTINRNDDQQRSATNTSRRATNKRLPKYRP
jgi:hypothetical protein